MNYHYHEQAVPLDRESDFEASTTAGRHSPEEQVSQSQEQLTGCLDKICERNGLLIFLVPKQAVQMQYLQNNCKGNKKTPVRNLHCDGK